MDCIETTKQSILRCAIELGREIGFEKTSIRRICKKANLSIGAFYHYFKSKEDLVNEAFMQFDATLNAQQLNSYAALPPLAAIKKIVMDHLIHTVSLGCPLVTEFYRSLLQHEFRRAISTLRVYYRTAAAGAARAKAAGIYRAELADDEIAEFFIRFARGNTIDWCLHNGDYDVVAVTERQIDSLLYADFLLTDKTKKELRENR